MEFTLNIRVTLDAAPAFRDLLTHLTHPRTHVTAVPTPAPAPAAPAPTPKKPKEVPAAPAPAPAPEPPSEPTPPDTGCKGGYGNDAIFRATLVAEIDRIVETLPEGVSFSRKQVTEEFKRISNDIFGSPAPMKITDPAERQRFVDYIVQLNYNLTEGRLTLNTPF